LFDPSASGAGVIGATATAGAAAVVGATNGVAGAYAAASYGPVIVSGDFTVVGGPKARPCHIPAARTDACIAWRVPRAGLRTLAKAN
jgi:hypothetical protein